MYVFLLLYTLQVTNDDCTGQQLPLFFVWHCERCTSHARTACPLAVSQEHDDLQHQGTAAVFFFQASETCCGRQALSFLSSFCSTPGECGPVCNTRIPGALTCRVNSPCVQTYYAAFHASHPDHVKPLDLSVRFYIHKCIYSVRPKSFMVCSMSLNAVATKWIQQEGEAEIVPVDFMLIFESTSGFDPKK